MNKNKIAILINNMGGGGAERTVANLLNCLKDDFEIHLILLGKRIDYKLPEKQIVEFIDDENSKRTGLMKVFKIPLVSYKLAKYCKKNDITLVFSFLNRSNFMSCFSKKIGLKSKVLISEQAYTPLVYLENTISGKVGKYLVSRLYPLADAILPNSKGTRDILMNHFNVHSNYIVIKNPTSISEILSKKKEKVEDVKFDKFTFISVAGFRRQKNHHLLIDAFNALDLENVQLLLIGKGELFEEIKQKVAFYGIQDKVIFLGHSDNPFKYLDKANCFVLSSNFEGFPNALIEAMACETPIISTDCKTGPRELLAPDSDYHSCINDGFEIGTYGILVPVGDKNMLAKMMSEIIKNKELQDRYKAASLNKASEFDNAAVIQEFKDVINSYLS